VSAFRRAPEVSEETPGVRFQPYFLISTQTLRTLERDGLLTRRIYASIPPKVEYTLTPLGQTLIVTQGCGWVQSKGGPKVEIRAGDVVWCPPKEQHWHGATSTTAMSHIAIQEALDGKVIEWLEKVSDEQYKG